MAQRQKHHKLPKQIQRQILNYPQNDGIYDDSTIKAMRKERAVSNARVFFTSMVLLLGLAVLSAKGVEAHWPLINITTRLFHKWVYGGLSLVFLVWSLVVLLTAYSDWIARSKFGRIVDKVSVIGVILALVAAGIGWAQGVASSVLAGLDTWYVWTVFILGLAFIIMLAVFPCYRHRRQICGQMTPTKKSQKSKVKNQNDI